MGALLALLGMVASFTEAPVEQAPRPEKAAEARELNAPPASEAFAPFSVSIDVLLVG